MPCRDDYPIEDYNRSNTESHSSNTEELLQAKRKINNLTAMLCALTSELVQSHDGLELIKRAENDGKIDIQSFIQEHKAEDLTRLKKSLESYSVHELKLIKEILGEDGRF